MQAWLEHACTARSTATVHRLFTSRTAPDFLLLEARLVNSDELFLELLPYQFSNGLGRKKSHNVS